MRPNSAPSIAFTMECYCRSCDITGGVILPNTPQLQDQGMFLKPVPN